MDKNRLRQTIINARDQQSYADVKQKGQHIYQHVVDFDIYQQAETVMLFLSYLSEVPTLPIIKHAFSQGKRLITPVVDNEAKQLKLIQLNDLNHLSLSRYGILEPHDSAANTRALSDVDLILSPGVAFDLTGQRIGYGGGYYDKLLGSDGEQRQRIAVYGLAFELQVVPQVPTDPYDQKIDGLITEKRIYTFTERR